MQSNKMVFINKSFKCLTMFLFFQILHMSSSKSIAPLSRLPFEDCGSYYDLINIQISGCPQAPCKVVRNEVVKLTAYFATETDILNGKENTNRHIMTHEAKWYSNSIYKKASITPERCDTGNLCPIRYNNGFQFEANIKVDSSLPLMASKINWRVTDNSGKLVICFKAPVTIVSR